MQQKIAGRPRNHTATAQELEMCWHFNEVTIPIVFHPTNAEGFSMLCECYSPNV